MREPTLSRQEIASALTHLGVQEEMTVVVHASLSSFGEVEGGPSTLCEAIRDAVGQDGTIVMPGFTSQIIHPAWRVDRHGSRSSYLAAEEAAAVFNKDLTPVGRKIGATAEIFRKQLNTKRSGHPYVSFLANGPEALDIVGTHPLPYRFSENSPLGALYDRDTLVLMLGVSWEKCTALHLAEYIAAYPGRRFGKWLVPTHSSAKIEWVFVDDLLLWEGDFQAIGEHIAKDLSTNVSHTCIGGSKCVAVGLRCAVDSAVRWMELYRDLESYRTPPGWRDIQFR